MIYTDPFGIHIGTLFYIRYYGLIIVAGAFAAAWLAARLAQRRGLHPDLIWDGLIWALVGGIVGARLWHVFTPPPSMVQAGFDTLYYLQNPLEIVSIWNGGLGIPGAVIGGLLAVWVYARRHKVNFVTLMDVVAPALPLGQAIGRWGNFINQELYGLPTTLPWGIAIENPLPPYTPDQRFHPLFLYESLLNLALCGTLLWAGQRQAHRLKPGDLFWLYLIGYPAIRFVLDFLRLDNAQVFGINANQTFMVMVIVGAVFALLYNHRRRRRHEQTAPPPTEVA